MKDLPETNADDVLVTDRTITNARTVTLSNGNILVACAFRLADGSY
ncbi:hypothetical protein AB1M95_17880 [Sulfitobacter sp. LCG007]